MSKGNPARDAPTKMKTIVYFADASIEATVHADAHVSAGIARYATKKEIRSYERGFQIADYGSQEWAETQADNLGESPDY